MGEGGKEWREGGGEGVQVTDMSLFYIVYIELRVIVFIWNTVNSRYLNVKVHTKLFIF